MGCCCEVDGDEGKILKNPLEIESPEGNCCSPIKVDKVPDFANCNDCFCCWLKGVKVVFLLKKGPPENFNGCCERLKANVMAVTIAVGTEIDFVNCYGEKHNGGGMFPAVVAFVYIKI